ncbi:lipopolysaccharide biosynthesis protein [Nonomuraea sp. NPDC050790]|uniref:lipopolysaccharide biosynthesis protein n=1 Tax=Nonomuraea sp. NPDC050790 TaxID=3364371 RepID=UPI0037957DAA
MTERGLKRFLPADLDDPLLRSAYSLMLNAGAGAVIGLAYWTVTARVFDEKDVGVGMAILAAMRFLAAITSFGFVGTVARFVPEAGRHTARFVGTVYGAATGLAVAGCAVFLLTLTSWGETYSLLSGWTAGMVFTVMVIVWSICTLQDVVLTGLRKAPWVPVANLIFWVARFAVLAVCALLLARSAGASVSWAVFLAWIAPGLIVSLCLNTVVFRKLIPQHARLTAGKTLPPARQIGRFLAGDYAGSIFTLLFNYGVPVLVAAQVSKEMNAYYGLTITLGAMLEMLSYTMASSLTVEGAFDKDTLSDNCRRALRRTFVILTPLVLAATLLAPVALLLFGEGYAQHAADLMRLIALAALPRAVVELYLGALRALRRAGMIVFVQFGMAVMAIGGAQLLLPVHGITGVGIAILASQTITAVAVLPGLWRIASGRAQPTRLHPPDDPGGAQA